MTSPPPPKAPAPKATPAPKAPKAPSSGEPAAVRHTRRAAELYSAAKLNRGSKPSTTGTAVKGAASGAALGAAVGSVVPGVGTAVGGATGAVLGGAGGAIKGSRDKARWKAAGRSPADRALLAEFTLCLIVVALAPAAKPAGEVTPAAWMKRGSAVCALFILLGMLSAVGPRTGRVAVALGGLVTLGLMVDNREVFGVLAGKLGPGVGRTLDGDGGGDADQPTNPTGSRDAPTPPV